MYPIRDLFFLVTIATLFCVGAGLSLWSGQSALDRNRGRGRHLLGNLSRLVLGLASLFVLVSMAHTWMGYRIGVFP